MELVETAVGGGLLRWAPPDLSEPRELTLVEKIALERKDAELTARAADRDELCWLCGKLRAVTWVREVCFDFKGEKAAPVRHAKISSADYPGRVPGFCRVCWDGPRRLAGAVYRDRPEIRWGAVPTRWFVVCTDGQVTGGGVDEINPTQWRPKIEVS